MSPDSPFVCIAGKAEGGMSENIDPADLPRTFCGVPCPSLNEERTWNAWQAAERARELADAADEWRDPAAIARELAECARLEREYERAVERSAAAQDAAEPR